MVARRLGISLLGVGFVEGRPFKLGTGVANESDNENPIYSAGGMAAGEILFGAYDPHGSITDRESILITGASVQDSIRAAREILTRDEILFIGKRIEDFATQNDTGYISESNLFAKDHPEPI